jgi:hypothetical protein
MAHCILAAENTAHERSFAALVRVDLFFLLFKIFNTFAKLYYHLKM